MFMESFTVDKALNNNVIIAKHPSLGEVVLIDKGIGFGKNRVTFSIKRHLRKCLC